MGAMEEGKNECWATSWKNQPSTQLLLTYLVIIWKKNLNYERIYLPGRKIIENCEDHYKLIKMIFRFF